MAMPHKLQAAQLPPRANDKSCLPCSYCSTTLELSRYPSVCLAIQLLREAAGWRGDDQDRVGSHHTGVELLPDNLPKSSRPPINHRLAPACPRLRRRPTTSLWRLGCDHAPPTANAFGEAIGATPPPPKKKKKRKTAITSTSCESLVQMIRYFS